MLHSQNFKESQCRKVVPVGIFLLEYCFSDADEKGPLRCRRGTVGMPWGALCSASRGGGDVAHVVAVDAVMMWSSTQKEDA